MKTPCLEIDFAARCTNLFKVKTNPLRADDLGRFQRDCLNLAEHYKDSVQQKIIHDTMKMDYKACCYETADGLCINSLESKTEFSKVKWPEEKKELWKIGFLEAGEKVSLYVLGQNEA